MTIEELCIEFPHYDGCATDSISMTFYSQRACAEEPIDQPCSGDHPNCTFEDCMAHCVNEENCEFFFRKNDGNCFLYPSCDETSWKRGFTFKLTRGSDAEFSSSPSRIPSSIPSHSPTDVSNAPSINPSRLLSSFPSSNPTRTPTSNPSRPPASAVRNLCMNWFGNNLDWSVIPYEQHSGSPWGFTPTGCTIASVQAYGAYHCGVLTASGSIQSCDGNDCFNGACSDGFQESMDDYEYSFGEEEEPPLSSNPSRLPSSIPSRPPSSNPSRPPASAVKRN